MKKIILNILVIVGIILLAGCGSESDALKFKNEYESLNGTTIGNTKYKYPSVEIIKDNAVK